MTEKNQIKQNEGKGGINPAVAVATGAVIGAGIAVAGAVALKDKKNRKKVKEMLSNAKDFLDQEVKDAKSAVTAA